ncbi:MAG: ATPase F0F1 [Calditrichaeota bacterium]|nr:AtpZ/AtpI family protein [Calditrichota bacterium]RQW04906.1 MAG: ATPase F0F1 [Calditrichota bacterium]
MNDSEKSGKKELKNEFLKKIEKKESRKQKSRRDKEEKSIWFGMGMFGLIGWSVAIPTLLFLAIGIWIDSVTEGTISWTLTFLFIGVVLGCLNAWHWVKKESRD